MSFLESERRHIERTQVPYDDIADALTAVLRAKRKIGPDANPTAYEALDRASWELVALGDLVAASMKADATPG